MGWRKQPVCIIGSFVCKGVQPVGKYNLNGYNSYAGRAEYLDSVR